jgi:hypothetical protein
MKDQPSAPSLEQLQRQICWWWMICEKCLRGVPVALGPVDHPMGRECLERQAAPLGALPEMRMEGATLQHPISVVNRVEGVSGGSLA